VIFIDMLKYVTGILYCVTIAYSILAFDCVSAEDETAEALFSRGLLRYRQEKYVSARLDFNEIIERYKSSPRLTSSYMLLSKTLYNLGDFEESASVAAELQKKFPGSRYREWCDYIISACDFNRGNVSDALNRLARLARYSKDNDLRVYTLRAMRYTIQPAVDSGEFKKALDNNDLKLADLINIEPLDETERRTIVSLEAYNNASRYRHTGSTIKIGLLAPLTGANSKQGNQLLLGVEEALKEKEIVDGKRIELLVEDTGSDQIQAVLKTRRLIQDGVLAIIGPVYGESTITAAIEANDKRIPFIAPTAQNSKLTQIGPYVFQLNFNPAVQAKALAVFAVNTLGFSTAAVIASQDQWGEAVAETFEREMHNLGAEIIPASYFDVNTSLRDYNPIIMKIRDNAPATNAVPVNTIVIDNGNAFPDTIVVKLDPASFGPQRLVPVETIDCILISALSYDAIQLAQQIIQYNVNTVLLGDSGWSFQNIAEEGGSAVDGAYIVSLGSEKFNVPGNNSTTGLDDIISMRGYEAFSLIAHCLEKGAHNPENFVETLESIEGFKGLSSRITLDPNYHTNTAVDFVKIQNGMYIKVPQKIPVTGN